MSENEEQGGFSFFFFFSWLLMTDLISMWETEDRQAVAVEGRDDISFLHLQHASQGSPCLDAPHLGAKWMNKKHYSDQLSEPINPIQDSTKVWKGSYEKMILNLKGRNSQG